MKKVFAIVGCLLFLLSLSITAYAGPYVLVPNPVSPIPGDEIPPPDVVPGKEYLDSPNKNQLGNNAPGRAIAWDGNGGVTNTRRYKNIANTYEEADALAHRWDSLFFSLIANTSAVLFSVTGDSLQAIGPAPIYYESTGGAIGVWATALQVDQHGVNDLVGLEVWGPEGIGMDNAGKYSLLGEPDGISVYNYGTGGTPTPYITQAQIAAAIGVSDPDVDALMVFDGGATNAVWDAGDWIMFSIWPTGSNFGDEVYVWQNGGLPFPLNHGGHLWNNGWLGLNVDALEAVSTPEPCTLLLLGSGVAGIIGFGRKRLFKKA